MIRLLAIAVVTVCACVLVGCALLHLSYARHGVVFSPTFGDIGKMALLALFLMLGTGAASLMGGYVRRCLGDSRTLVLGVEIPNERNTSAPEAWLADGGRNGHGDNDADWRESASEIVGWYHTDPSLREYIFSHGCNGDMGAAYIRLRDKANAVIVSTDPGVFRRYEDEIAESRHVLQEATRRVVRKYRGNQHSYLTSGSDRQLWELFYSAQCLLRMMQDRGVSSDSEEFRKNLTFHGKESTRVKSGDSFEDDLSSFICACVASRVNLADQQ